MRNQTLQLEHEIANAALATAEQEVAAYRKQISGHHVRISVTQKRLKHQITSAQSEVDKARFDFRIADAQVQRMKPLAEADNVAKIDYEQALSTRNSLQAAINARMSELKSLKVALEAIEKNILVMGDRVDDSLGEMKAKLTIAEAKVKELQVAERLAKKNSKGIDIIAQRDGVVYAIYRQKGEFLKIAEEVLAINLPDRSWASGHVPAAEAVKIRPGQEVNVSIPSMGIVASGTVAAIGHRAVHGKGGYTAEFRGEAMDVPIKVQIHELPRAVPSGIRLKMAVKLGFPWNKEKSGELLTRLENLNGNWQNTSASQAPKEAEAKQPSSANEASKSSQQAMH